MSKNKISILLIISILFLNIILYINFPTVTEKDYFNNDTIEKDIMTIKEASGQSVSPTKIGNFSDGGNLWDVFVSGDIAYVTDLDQGLEIINVSDPYNPSLLGKYGDDANFTRGIYVSGCIAYLADNYDGLNIINVSDPTNPTLLSKFANKSFPNEDYGYWDVKVSGGVAYTTIQYYNGYNNSYGGLDIINVSDPTNPTLLGKYGDFHNCSHDVYLCGNIAYIADWGESLEVIDVSDPVHPSELGQYPDVPYTAGNTHALCVSESIAYTAAGEDGIEIIDVSDPHNPTKLGEFDDGGDSWDIDISDGIAYVSDADGGLEIIDVSDPHNPAKLGEFDDGGDIVNAFISGGIAYLADWYEGLEIIELGFDSGTWLPPKKLGDYRISNAKMFSVFVRGNTAFVAAGDRGLRIIDVSDPTNPNEIGQFGDAYNYSRDVFVSGNIAYVADWEDGLEIINISDSRNPILLGKYQDAYNKTYDVFVSGHLAYIADWNYGFEIIDVSDPTSPKKVGYYDTGAAGVFVSGNIAYVAGGDDGLEIYDVSSPTDVRKLGNYSDEGFAFDVFVSGDIAYVADGDDGLEIIDVGDPTNPKELGQFNNFGEAKNVYVSGNVAYVADFYDGLEIIDVSDPRNATQLDVFYDGGNACDVHLSGNIAYVADYSSDLEIIDTGYDGDDDHLTNIQELIMYHTNLNNPDTDNDNLSDGDEILIHSTDPNDSDSDDDNILDGEEVILGLDGYITDPSDPDSDDDSIQDGEEVILGLDGYITNPTSNDTEVDGMPDGWEVSNNLDPTIDDSSDDPDNDNLINFQEYLEGTDPYDPDSDGDGYSDGKEIEAGTDPLNPEEYPTSPSNQNIFFINLIVIIISIFGSIFGSISLVFYLRMKGMIGGRPGINIFISHKIDEFEKYKIELLARYLEKNKDINKVFFSEKEIHGDIDDWMEKNVPLCQVLMYIATKKSLKSEGCHHEIQVALENDLEILPIVGDDIKLLDLKQLNNLQLDLENKKIEFKDLNLHRKIALNYLPVFEEFYQNLMDTLNKFIEPLNTVLLKLKESSVSNVNLLEKKLGYNEEKIIKFIKILLKVHKIKGALTADHSQFLNKKEVMRRIDLTKEQGRYEDINELIIDAGIDKESIDDVKILLGKHYAQKVKTISA